MERRVPADGFLLGAKMSTYDIKIGVFFAMLNQKKEEDKLADFKAAALA
jgi:hypothetical protein